MAGRIETVLRPIGKALAASHRDILADALPPKVTMLLDDLRQVELDERKARFEARGPKPIATDDAPGG